MIFRGTNIYILVLLTILLGGQTATGTTQSLPLDQPVSTENVISTMREFYQTLGGDSLRVMVGVPYQVIDAWLKKQTACSADLLLLERLAPGRQVATLQITDAFGREIRQHFEVDLELRAMMAVPLRLIKKGETITAADVVVEEREITSSAYQSWVLQPGAIMGLEADRHLSPGAPVRWDQLTLPTLVHKGSEIEAMLQSGVVVIKTVATALQGGAGGDEIWVRLNDSGKRMKAVIVDASTVRLR